MLCAHDNILAYTKSISRILLWRVLFASTYKLVFQTLTSGVLDPP